MFNARLTDIKVVEDDIFVVGARDHHRAVDKEASDPILMTAQATNRCVRVSTPYLGGGEATQRIRFPMRRK